MIVLSKDFKEFGMLKILTLLLFIYGYSFAQTGLVLHKGWQLIGATSDITDMSIFEASHVEQIWHFDAATQKWRGYSPDPATAQKIRERGYDSVDSLKSWHGFWIKSRDEWILTLPDDRPSDENITLQKGWNLISLPVNSVVSPHIFDGDTVWKYAQKDGWQLFDPDNTEHYPAITHITNSDGIWVKSNRMQSISTITVSAKLHNFQSVAAMQSYIEDMVQNHQRPWIGYMPVEPLIKGAPVEDFIGNSAANSADKSSVSAAPQAGETSETNIQEAGVDESDILKHDDTYIYYLGHDPQNWEKRRLNVTTFARIAQGETEPLATKKLEGYATALYLVGERLVVLSRYGSQNYKIENPTAAEQIAIDQSRFVPSTLVEIYDITDPKQMRRMRRFKIEGIFNDSRLIDGKLYLITQFTPYIEMRYPPIYVDAPECKDIFDPTPQPVESVDYSSGDTTGPAPVKTTEQYTKCYTLQQDENGSFYRPDYDHPQISYKKLLPYYTRDSEAEEMLITPESLYTSDNKDQKPVITTIGKIDIANATLETTASIMGENNTVYASQKALYLVSNQYPLFYTFDKYRERSVIYRFRLGDDLGYDAIGFVPGKVLNQFSLSEYREILRIATTTGNSWEQNSVNSLYTLKPIDHMLIIQGVLSGLGEKGETIHAVRFLGERGYVVTFRQTDPFYTLDLSDPLQPRKVGELKVDGYSAYLHPVDENLVLGIGRDATPDGQTTGLKIELFDISDFAHPKTLDSYTLTGNYTKSPLEWSHKALAYRNSDRLFAFPYSKYINNAKGVTDYLGVYQIADQKLEVYQPPIASHASAPYDASEMQRGLLFDLEGETYIAFFDNGEISYQKLSVLRKEPR